MKTHDNTAVPQWAKDAARSYWTYEGTHTPEFLAQIIARHAPAQVAELERDKARIEFLANHPESMPYLEDGIWRIPYLGGVSSYHRTLSGCIDAAMNHKTK